MAESILKYKIAHWIFRLLVLFIVIDLFLDQFYSPDYYAWFREMGLANLLFALDISAVLLIPMCVAFEFWWMRKIESERRALAIDSVIAIGLVAVWVGGLLYAFTHFFCCL